MGWTKKYKFSDLYEMSSGISSKPEQAGHGEDFLSFSTVFNNYFLPDELPDKMNTSEREQTVYSILAGDIFLTRTSETIDELGMSSVALKEYPKATYSGFLKRLRATQTDVTYAKYLGFYLRSDLFRKTMTNNAIMTLRASLNEQIFSYLDLLLPEFDEQKKIGDYLHSLNQKIELNNEINAELEAMAKLIYDYWFVQFDFPDENGKPYKSSGGKMAYNEELKREIPEGWEDGTLDDIMTLHRGVTYGKDDVKSIEDKGVVPVLRATNITGNTIDLEDMVYVSSNLVGENQKMRVGDILITMSSGSKNHIGKNGMFHFDKEVGFGAFCARMVAKHGYKEYLYGYTQSDFMSVTIQNECLGTNINNLNGSLVKGFRLVIPPMTVLQKFKEIIEPLLKKQGVNQKENQELASVRDWLLPMLMNGQVKVGEGKEVLKAAEDGVGYGTV